eukprot:COSAG05_NODE_355_length_10856_cov_7.197174_2_plen_88_part_00
MDGEKRVGTVGFEFALGIFHRPHHRWSDDERKQQRAVESYSRRQRVKGDESGIVYCNHRGHGINVPATNTLQSPRPPLSALSPHYRS